MWMYCNRIFPLYFERESVIINCTCYIRDPNDTWEENNIFASGRCKLKGCEVHRIIDRGRVSVTFRNYKRTQVMAFRGTDPVRTKIVIDGNVLEQVSNFDTWVTVCLIIQATKLWISYISSTLCARPSGELLSEQVKKHA